MRAKLNRYALPLFILMPIIAIFGTAYVVLTSGLHMATLALSIFYLFATGVTITAGYHRLFSHLTYKAAWPVRLFYVLFGAAAFQGSVLEWATDHREHHRYTDQEKDPYNIKKGLWYAHLGWILRLDPSKRTFKNVEDLNKDPMLIWQHKHFVLIAIFMCLVVPTAIAALWGDALGGLLIAGALRLVINQHFTFSINSFCHYFGKKTFSDISARDNWVFALFTFGEGFHNFHHQFSNDYRNGIRWYHYDPSKWLIWALAKLGLARDLKTVDQEVISRAEMHMEAQQLLIKQGVCPTRLEELITPIREKLQQIHTQLVRMRREYAALRAQQSPTIRATLREYKANILAYQREFQEVLKTWTQAKESLVRS